MRVTETQLPGVGVRHDFDTQEGKRIGVIVHRDGRRDIITYRSDDPDACSSVLELSEDGARTIAELLGASQVTEAVTAVRQDIDGLGIEWIHLEAGSPAAGTTLMNGEYRSKTGASIVAILRGQQSVPAPEPGFELAEGDTVVAVGTDEGLIALRQLLRP